MNVSPFAFSEDNFTTSVRVKINQEKIMFGTTTAVNRDVRAVQIKRKGFKAMAIEKKSLTGKKTTPKKNTPKVGQLTTKLKTASPFHAGNLSAPKPWIP